MSVVCNSCYKIFPDYRELALHIASEKKGHRSGKKWAANFLLKTKEKASQERFTNGRTALTDGEKDNKLEMVRQLSGEQRESLCVCPKCKRVAGMMFEEEYASSPVAWRIDGRIAKLCHGCSAK